MLIYGKVLPKVHIIINFEMEETHKHFRNVHKIS